MKHDFRSETDGPAAEQFSAWLQHVTTDDLKRHYDNAEGTKAAVFLYVNRAYEAHMPESQVAELLAKAVVHAGYSVAEEEAVFAWLDAFAPIARGTHGGA